MTKVSKCTCENKGQDSIHGDKQRVFNETSKKRADTKVYRCTVCSSEKTIGSKES